MRRLLLCGALLSACSTQVKSTKQGTDEVAQDKPETPKATKSVVPKPTAPANNPAPAQPAVRDPIAPQHSVGGNKWTVMVYMAADNNLEEYALQDLGEMMQAAGGENLTILVQVDRAQGFDERPIGGVANFTDTKRVRVLPDRLELIETVVETNTGDPNTLKDFIVWAANEAPADRYGLLLWNHGNGWQGFGSDKSADNDSLSLAEMSTAIGQARTAARLPEFALLGFDACLMATVETAIALEAHTELLLASEELEPGPGWDYTSLAVLKTSPGADAVAIGRAIQQGFIAGQELESVTLSLIDTLKLAPVRAALDAFSSSVLAQPDAALAQVARSQNAILSFVSNAVDLGDFAHRVGAMSTALNGPGSALENAVRDLVVARIAGAASGSATGITVYFPLLSRDYLSLYDSIAGMQSWRTFLKDYYARADRLLQPKLVAGSLSLASPDAVGVRALSAFIDMATLNNVASVMVLSSSGAGDICAFDAAEANGANVSGVFSDTAITITQGNASSLLFADLRKFDVYNGSGRLKLPVNYYASPSAFAELAYYDVNVSAWSIDSYTLFRGDDAGFGQLHPVAGSTVEAVLGRFSPAQGFSLDRPTGVRLDATQPVDIEVGFFPWGHDVHVTLVAQSANGLSASLSTSFAHN